MTDNELAKMVFTTLFLGDVKVALIESHNMQDARDAVAFLVRDFRAQGARVELVAGCEHFGRLYSVTYPDGSELEMHLDVPFEIEDIKSGMSDLCKPCGWVRPSRY